MLIICPECELQVSDKATTCPHCGFPMKSKMAPKKKRAANKRRRLPNGFGQISEVGNGNLRAPFRAMITVGKTPEGKPICRPLKPKAYFKTYNDAYAALVEYHKNPYDLDSNMTIEQLYEKWCPIYFETLASSSSRRSTRATWKYCTPLYHMQVVNLKAHHIRACIEGAYIIENGEKKLASSGTKERMKSLFNMMLGYAVEHDLVQYNVAKNFSLDKKIHRDARIVKNEHMPFTDEEMQILWDNLYKVENVDMILIQCYSGWRPQELGTIELANVDLNKWTMIAGMKTDAGKDRLVPIHTRIRDLVVKRYNESIELGSRYLLNTYNKKYGTDFMTYAKYAYRFMKVIKDLELDPEHKPHDGRKHFVTKAKKYKVDEYAIKYIIGHEIDDITEKVYTERDPEWLAEEIEKIK